MTDKAHGLLQLRDEVTRYSGLLSDADFAAPVAACPSWTVEDLNSHIGQVHRWATGILASGSHVAFEGVAEPGKQAGIAWFEEGAAGLLESLQTIDIDQPCWSFGPPRTARFWLRRQVQELFVHRIDLEIATQRPSPRDPDMASDGIDEVFEVFIPRMAARGLAPTLQEPVSFVCTDAEGAWTIEPDLSFTRTAGANAVLSGPAEALLLWLWQRCDDHPLLQRSGADRAIAALRTGMLTP